MGLTSYWNGMEKSEHVFFVGQGPASLMYYIDSHWNHNDLTRVTASEGAPNAEICPALTRTGTVPDLQGLGKKPLKLP
jgi:hypothetical protein